LLKELLIQTPHLAVSLSQFYKTLAVLHLSQFHMFTQMAGNTRYGFLRVWDSSTFKDWYFDHSAEMLMLQRHG
jgi:hypothetical protein